MAIRRKSVLPHKHEKWREYFLEFLMIFLGVTLGFFAENFRQNLSEKTQETEIIESVAKDLAADTIAINQTIDLGKKFLQTSDSLIILLGKKQLNQEDMEKVYRLSILNMSAETVNFNKIGISELKNNGAAQFIQNKRVLKAITNYDLKSDELVNQGKIVTDFSLKIIDHTNSLFDYRSFSKNGTVESYLKKEEYKGEYDFIKNDPVEMRRFSNLIFMRGAIISRYNKMLQTHKTESSKLLKEIKSDYQFED